MPDLYPKLPPTPLPPSLGNFAIDEMHAKLGLGKVNQPAPAPNKSEKIRFEFTVREFTTRRREIWEQTFCAVVQGQFASPAGARADSILVAMENADATAEVWATRVTVRPSMWERILGSIFVSRDVSKYEPRVPGDLS